LTPPVSLRETGCIMSDERSGVVGPSALWLRLGLARHNFPGRFTTLLLAIILLLVSQPMFAGHDFAQAFVTVSISLVLLSALWAFRETRTYFAVALVLTVPSIGCRLAMQFTANPTLEMVGAISSCMFLIVTVFALVSRLFIVRRVSLDTISAAICAYLLMGIAWAFAFAAVELRQPNSFSEALLQRTSGSLAPLLASLHSFIYYSFVCLTTTGFGDIAPVTEAARILSVTEAVFGQLYMAILIARLVSLEVAQSLMKER
jgi:voltage-gated potassium channel